MRALLPHRAWWFLYGLFGANLAIALCTGNWFLAGGILVFGGVVTFALLAGTYETANIRNWVAFDEGHRFEHPPEKAETLISWCRQNCRGRWVISAFGCAFSRAEDATLFKLMFDAKEVRRG